MIVELQSDDLLKNTSKRKTFSHTLDFDVAKNHSKTIAKERSIIVNISEIIGEQVIRYLRSRIFKNDFKSFNVEKKINQTSKILNLS